MIRIVDFEDKYLKDIEDINVSVSRHPDKPLEEKKLCRFVYIDYYAFNSKENCFVALDDNDEVVGYVVGESDLYRYKDIMLNKYMDEAKALRPDFEQYLYNEVSFYERWNNEYDAHMHMDVKPCHQHQGIGTMLIQHQIEHYRNKGCKGMMLLCSSDNINANNFYQKNGIDIIEETTCNIRGIKL